MKDVRIRSLPISDFSFLFILLAVAGGTTLAADARFSSGKSALAIPFEIEDNLIYLNVSVNNSKPLSFILDTGAYTIVDLSRARELAMDLKLTGKSDGIGDEQQDVFAGTKKVSFGLPGVTLSDQRLVAVMLTKVEECVNLFVVDATGRDISGSSPSIARTRKVDGILGKEFFSNFVVEIDYAARVLNVYEPRSYKYSGRGEKLPLEIEPQHIFVSGQISGEGQPPIRGRFMVDTGSSMVATLTKRFTDDHKLLPPRDQLSTLPVCGLAGMMTTKSLVGTVGALQLGSLKFSSPVVEFRQAGDYDFDGYIGGALLRRHKVIFDYSRGVMILEPVS